MKRKLIRGISFALAMVMCMAVGAFAATNLQEIKAYLNYDLAIRYDGELQTMYDANGNKVIPISYNGTTYLPIRAVGNMMGIDVLWDAENYQVLLGKTGQAIDFIENFEPYSKASCKHMKYKDNGGFVLGEKTYSHYVELYNKSNAYYDIGGKYDTFVFDVYSANSQTIRVYGDNKQLLATIDVKGQSLPQTVKINVTGVHQLSFEKTLDLMFGDYLYLLNMFVE